MIDPSEAYKKSHKRSPKELDDRLLSAAHIEAARNADANKAGFNWMPAAAFGVVCIMGISIVLNNGIDQIEGDIAYFEEASLSEQPAPSVADLAAPTLEEIIVTARRAESAIAEVAVGVDEVELFTLAQEAFSENIDVEAVVANFDTAAASAPSIFAPPLLPQDPYLVDLTSYIPDLVLDIRYSGTNNFVGEPIDGYLSAKALVTEEAALALVRVQQQAGLQGLGLKIFDAYRPEQAVYHFIRWASDIEDQQTKADYYPNVDKTDLFEQGYIVFQSSHSRASTVDVTLINLEEGTELDMGSPYDFFDPISSPSSTEVSEQARQNRQLLRSLITAQGFVPNEAEWWHFTLANEPFPNRAFNMPVE